MKGTCQIQFASLALATWLALLAYPPPLGGQNQPRQADLAKGIAESARRACEEYEKDYYDGFGSQDRFYVWSRRLFRAQVESAQTDREKAAAAEAHLARMTKLEQVTKRRFDGRLATKQEYSAATYYKLRAEQAVQGLRKEKDR
jgi:hypothetical protein